MTTTTSRVLRYGGRELPVTLPSLRDPRLHVAAVLISIHVLGQTALRFQVSVVQILAAIVTAAIVEAAWELRRSGRLVWPASAILTGSGVALIFRVLGTEHGDYWSWRDWHLFAAVAGLSVVTKYAIRYRGSHLFNPSNLGLVVAFLVLGSSRAEPLDFWWAPLDLGMTAAYLIILVGGLVVTARLRLLAMALSFWVTLTAAAGVLAGSGHCMTARWAFEPVCGSHFWWVIVTSPEVLVFLFFMITDPKTVPSGPRARVTFGAAVAMACIMLIAPQATEFGAKVALLGGLVVMCAARPLFDRFVPERERRLGDKAVHPAPLMPSRPARVLTRGAVAVSVTAILALGIVLAGAPARESPDEVGAEALRVAPDVEALRQIDATLLPPVAVDPDVVFLFSEMTGAGAQELAVTFAGNLRIEAEALIRGDRTLLTAVDHGNRLTEMQERVDEAAATGEVVVDYYSFDSLYLALLLPYGNQGGLRLGFEARGSLEAVTFDADGNELSRATSPCAVTFVLREITDDTWLIVDALPLA